MSIITKIFAVILVVECLVGSVGMIQYIATSQDYKALYEKEALRASAAEAQAANNTLAIQQLQEQLRQSESKRQGEAKQHFDLLDAKQAELASLNSKYNTLNSSYISLNASLAELKEGVKKETTLRETAETQLNAVRGQRDQLADQFRRAQDQLREKLANIENLTRSVQVLQEQLATSESEVLRLREQLKAGATEVAGAVEVQPPKIEATVTAVHGDIAALNVGSASGVKKGMDFIIYQGSNFVGNLKVADVYPSSCAGIITKAVRDVKVDQKATTRLE